MVKAPKEVCPFTTYTASVDDSGDGVAYHWLVTGGTLVSANRNVATITAGAGGSVSIDVTVLGDACSGGGSATTYITNQLVPRILATEEYCGAGPATASVDHASNYASYAWQIGDGVIEGPATARRYSSAAPGCQ